MNTTKLTNKEKFMVKVIHEYNHGGITSDCSSLTIRERKALLNYNLKGGKCLDICHLCE